MHEVTTRTISETAFETFCERTGLSLARVPEGKHKTPDYLLTVSGVIIVTEVKETERNKEEQESDRVLAATGVGLVTGGTPGARVRSMIADASPQIKARAAGACPSLLVLFDRGTVAGHLGPYHIRVAMYGLEQLHIAVPHQPSERPYAVGWGYGPKRKMTPSSNTSISALGVLFMSGPDSIHLHVYHNDHAAVPLDPGLLAPYGIPQYRLGEAEPGRNANWIEIV